MKIIAYRKHSDIDVEFLDKYHYVKRNNTYHNFKLGQIKNPYDRALFGVGFIGDGKWKVKDENGKFSRVYLCWMHMIERCYYEKNKDLHPSYFGLATVCPEWHNFQIFADWYKEREYEVDERLHLDKDIKHAGNMIYAPEHCLLVPQRINELFTCKRNNYGLPVGIKKTSSGKYSASYNGKNLGTFKTLDKAFEEYAAIKEKVIKEVANEYINIIREEVYLALMNYKVLIENDKNYVA